MGPLEPHGVIRDPGFHPQVISQCRVFLELQLLCLSHTLQKEERHSPQRRHLLC